MIKNLFDTRGGISMLDRCEECNEPIPSDSDSGLCVSCEQHYIKISDEEDE